ncbi:hypothetical protein BK126_09125 [Paenibacillus sp. FSL H7-0326]|nr:hypothetical protein BK126_09125 [Paenibacillus sp. FSL H7-0326]
MERNLSYLIIVYITKMEYLEINGADRVKKCVIAIIAAALLINFYGVFHADKAFACNCVSFEPNEAYEHAEAVYTGNKSLYTTRGRRILAASILKQGAPILCTATELRIAISTQAYAAVQQKYRKQSRI